MVRREWTRAMNKRDAINQAISRGGVAIRVGSDLMECRNGRRVPIFPVIQVVWAAGLKEAPPAGNIRVVWSDDEMSPKPGKSQKYMNIVTDHRFSNALKVPKEQVWVSYRCPKPDREVFQMLQQKWGCWYLLISEEGEDIDGAEALLVFNNGHIWPGSLLQVMNRLCQHSAEQLRQKFQEMFDEGVRSISQISPQMLPVPGVREELLATILRFPDVLEDLGGKLPWIDKELPHWGKPDKVMHDHIVSMYLEVIRALSSNDGTWQSTAKGKERHLMFDLMRRAKVFEVAPESLAELMRMAIIALDDEAGGTLTDLDSCVKSAKEGYTPPDLEDRVNSYMEATRKHAKSLSLPERMPFDVCWFGIGSGELILTDGQVEFRRIPEGKKYHIVGFLVTSDGEAHEILAFTKPGTSAWGFQIVTYHVNPETVENLNEAPYYNGWLNVDSLMPWTIVALVDAVNEHQSTILELRRSTPRTSSKFKKAKKLLHQRKPVPPAFYTVHMRDSVIRDVVKEPRGCPRSSPGHRYDRRGTYAHRIKRGSLPMDEKMEKRLRRFRARDGSRYFIFKGGKMPRKWRKLLRRRHLPPVQPGEWIAILRSWRSETICGPEDAPYIPSTRKATKGALANEKGIR